MEYRYRNSSKTFAFESMNLAQALATVASRIRSLLEGKAAPVSGYNDIAVYRAVAHAEQLWFEEWDRHQSSPYYGRLEYVDLDENNEQTAVYISKAQRSLAFEDANGRLTDIIPWNAPVARMYITHRSNPGIWDLERVTRLKIEDSELKEVADTYRSASLPSVNENEGEDAAQELFEKRGGGKLADIVATLQEEQYDLIVQPLRENLVIDGGPGSGKTEIALHRIVHLLHAEALSPQNILYLGPSGPFLRYVSEILPTLDADNVVLHDIASWLAGEIGMPVRKKWPSKEDSLFYGQDFVAQLDHWVGQYVEDAVRRMDALRMVFEVETVSGLHRRTAELPEEQVRDILCAPSLSPIKDRWRLIDERWRQIVDTALAGVEHSDYQRQSRVARQRFDTWRERAALLPDRRALAQKYSEVREACGIHTVFARDAVWSLPDALALLYLSGKIFGFSRHYSLIVLDEAQDLPPVGIAVARSLLSASPSSLTIVGDPYQHLNPYTAPQNWEAMAHDVGAQYIALKDNYRSGERIVDLANAVHPAGRRQIARRPGGIVHPPLSVSHGALAATLMAQAVHGTQQYRGQVAIIFGSKIPHALRDQLLLLKPDTMEMAVEPDAPEPFNVIIATVEYAKGLEFDMVILVAETVETFEESADGPFKLYTAISRGREEVMMFGVDHQPKLYETGWQRLPPEDGVGTATGKL